MKELPLNIYKEPDDDSPRPHPEEHIFTHISEWLEDGSWFGLRRGLEQCFKVRGLFKFRGSCPAGIV